LQLKTTFSKQTVKGPILICFMSIINHFIMY